MNPSLLYTGANFLHHTTCSSELKGPLVLARVSPSWMRPAPVSAAHRSGAQPVYGVHAVVALAWIPSMMTGVFLLLLSSQKERDVWLSIRAEEKHERQTETSALTPNTPALCGSSWRKGRHTQTSLEGGSCGDPGHSEDTIRHDKHDCTSLHKI